MYQRSARDRFNLLYENHKAKQRNELKASAISPEVTELDKGLDDLLERVAESNISHEKATEERQTNGGKEKSTEDEVRRRFLETFVETRKRNLEENPASSSFYWK